MSLTLPEGKNTAVAITLDFDAHSAWMGSMKMTSPAALSRGTFGAEVAVPRLIDTFDRFDIPATWFTPGHDLVTWPKQIESILNRGDEIAAHGCYHESIQELSAEEEARLMDVQLEQHMQVVGKKPRGYRSPAWDFTPHTAGLLEQHGFVYDSSLMGRDFEVYRPRPVEVNYESANTFGDEAKFLEIPVSCYLDDWPAVEYIAGVSNFLGDHHVMERRWIDLFDFAHARVENGVYVLTIHPQTSGRGHHLMVLEALLEHISKHDDVWFATMDQIAERWSDDDR